VVNYYSILGIDDFSTVREIKTRFRRIALRTHPDHTGGDEELTKIFLEAQVAYLFLLNDEKRNLLDNHLKGLQQSSKSEFKSARQEKTKAQSSSQNWKRNSERWKTRYDFTQNTGTTNPKFSCRGGATRANSDFFWLPNNIGPILYGDSELDLGFEIPSRNYMYEKLQNALIISFSFWGFTLLFSPNLFWKVIWILLPLTISYLVVLSIAQRFFPCHYVGVNGFAMATIEINNKNKKIVDTIVVPFESISALYFSNKEVKVSWRYDHSFIHFVCYDKEFNNLHHHFERYNKNQDVAPYSLSFYQKIEDVWTKYCLNKLEETIEKDGFVSFYQLDEEFKNLENVIKLTPHSIEFQKGGSYQFTEIGRVYLKQEEVYFESIDFQKSFFHSKGSIDYIALSRLGNRQFFITTLEILTGYKI
jgi:hypothetical protein